MINLPLARFRAWDRLKKKMLSPADLVQQEIDLSPMGGFVYQGNLMPHLEQMQSTGYLTPNDEEIFGGDLVNVEIDGEITTDVVQWAGGGWRFGGYENSLADYVVLKIVGNIFETRWPESTI